MQGGHHAQTNGGRVMFFDSWTLDGFVWSNIALFVIAVVNYFIGEARYKSKNCP